MDQRERKMRIDERLRAKYTESGIAVFYPEQFTEAGLGSSDEVVEALHALAVAEMLDEVVEIRSDEGDLCWQGGLAEFKAHWDEHHAFECEEHDHERIDVLEGHTCLHFEIPDALRKAIDAEKKVRRARSY